MCENKPFTSEQIERYCLAFKTLNSFNPEDETITSADVPKLVELMDNWERTPVQMQAMIDKVKYAFKDKYPLTAFRRLVAVQHDPNILLLEYANMIDQDNSGSISLEEYRLATKLLKGHAPNINEEDYEQFVKEADIDENGRVDIKEFTEWLKTKGLLSSEIL